jgi:predicted nucleic acid-binding protein
MFKPKWYYMEDQRSQKNKTTTVFVDTDILVAWAKSDDINHVRAEQIFRQLEDRHIVFFTSNDVFAEALTVVSQRVNHGTAIKLGNTLQSPDDSFQMKRVTEEVEELAFQIFIEQASKNVSFVDCQWARDIGTTGDEPYSDAASISAACLPNSGSLKH